MKFWATIAHRIFVSDCRIHQTQCVVANFSMSFHNKCIVLSFICYFLHTFMHLKHELSCLKGSKLLKLCGRFLHQKNVCSTGRIKHLKHPMRRIKCYQSAQTLSFKSGINAKQSKSGIIVSKTNKHH